MRLLEYQTGRFYKDCIYRVNNKHECAEKGFILAQWIAKGREFWLTSKDCTDKDFIKAVWEENQENDWVPEQELFEILARFLCGYDVYVEVQNSITKEKLIDKITDKRLKEKIDFIKTTLRIA